MAGSIAGGKLAAETNKLKYGEDYYKKIGSMGGKGDRGQRQDKGFGSMDPKKHEAASRKGGRISKRVKKV